MSFSVGAGTSMHSITASENIPTWLVVWLAPLSLSSAGLSAVSRIRPRPE